MAAYAGFILAIFPSISSIVQIKDIFEKLPPAFRALFAPGGIDITTPEGYIATEFFSLVGPLLFFAYTIAIGGSATAGEEERGTIDMLMAMPIPRWRVVFEKFLALDHQYVSPSYLRDYPLVVRRGEGMMVEDVDGNTFLDFNAGIAAVSTGHCHPDVVRAIQRQAATLIHMSGTDFYYPLMSELAAKLAAITPGKFPKRVYFGNSGTEGIEAAMKLARYHTKRHRFIAFLGCFHGRTFGALSLTASKPAQRRGFGPLLSGVSHVPYPNPYRCPIGCEAQGCADDCGCTSFIERLFQTTAPAEEVAAIVVEPIQGEGGYLVPPPSFLPRLRELADRHGILLIFDEVQCGMGRTGKMWASEHSGVAPDILVTAKGIASGLPLGLMVARADLMDWGPGAHASTFGGNPVERRYRGCANTSSC